MLIDNVQEEPKPPKNKKEGLIKTSDKYKVVPTPIERLDMGEGHELPMKGREGMGGIA